MGKMFERTIRTDKEGFYNITREVSDAVEISGVEEGIAIVYCPHTTAAITINENTDINVGLDMLLSLNKAFPNYKEFKHFEGNSFAHIKSSIIGCEKTIFISGGWLHIGAWQAIYFCEFDGPRERRYYIKVIEDK